MPSPAAKRFETARSRAAVLHHAAGDRRLSPQNYTERESLCHAHLAAVAAAWNGYIVGLTRDHVPATARPLDVPYSAKHTLLSVLLERALRKFNTPNTENTREILTLYTGYDPINDWIWPERGLGGVQVRERLNEIFKVRHSFAHGFPLPTLTWTQSTKGKVMLTKAASQMAEAFFANLVRRTDRGLRNHIRSIHGSDPWPD
jgi:hypothetical protein